jgi:hypothetical protein
MLHLSVPNYQLRQPSVFLVDELGKLVPLVIAGHVMGYLGQLLLSDSALRQGFYAFRILFSRMNSISLALMNSRFRQLQFPFISASIPM